MVSFLGQAAVVDVSVSKHVRHLSPVLHYPLVRFLCPVLPRSAILLQLLPIKAIIRFLGEMAYRLSTKFRRRLRFPLLIRHIPMRLQPSATNIPIRRSAPSTPLLMKRRHPPTKSCNLSIAQRYRLLRLLISVPGKEAPTRVLSSRLNLPSQPPRQIPIKKGFSTQAGGEYPTLTPTYSATSADPYNTDTHLQSITGTSYDEMAPALAPPVPSTTSGFHASPVDYGGSADITDITVQDNEALLRPSTAIEHVSQLYDENGIPIESSAHQPSSHNAIEPWPGSSASRGRISTEGLTPYLKFMKRHWVLKRLRNARQFAAAVPRTNSTCNSQKLSKVMAKVMMDDVTASKRAILKSTELAFDGDKYDVFCANGEFSYSIHSRKYCEVTKNAITCFAFR
ncbi:hypothetical protein V3C99_014304 [Haemonchus contortus]|uniref:Ground-like domain-containing protein n=1 Tax=Haemonchus contortus TaxID=6289 RepID=A0A7I4YTX9_HAECO